MYLSFDLPWRAILRAVLESCNPNSRSASLACTRSVVQRRVGFLSFFPLLDYDHTIQVETSDAMGKLQATPYKLYVN